MTTEVQDALTNQNATAEQYDNLMGEVRSEKIDVHLRQKEIAQGGAERRKVLETEDVDALVRLDKELEIVNAKFERLRHQEESLRKLRNQTRAREAAENIEDYYSALAKACDKVAAADKKLRQAWEEADAAYHELRQARGHMREQHYNEADAPPASDKVCQSVQAVWQCAHSRDMADSLFEPIYRYRVAEFLSRQTSVAGEGIYRNTVLV